MSAKRTDREIRSCLVCNETFEVPSKNPGKKVCSRNCWLAHVRSGYRRSLPSTESRARLFWSRTRSVQSGCIEWTGKTDGNGYGRLSWQYRGETEYWLAHRYAWSITFGDIAPGLFVCHRCDNPSCVNPEHLFLGTHTDNMRDMIQKGRQRRECPAIRGFNHCRSKLTPDDIAKIIALSGQGFKQRDIAMEIGVSQKTVWRVANGIYRPQIVKAVVK